MALIACPIFLYGLALRAPWQTWRMFFSIRALALAMLLALGAVATGIKPGISNVDSVAKAGDAKDGLNEEKKEEGK